MAVVIAPACPRLRAFFLKFSRIAPGLQSDAETDGLHVARLFSTRTTRKREAMARGGVAFHASFPNLADCAYRNSRLTRGGGRARGVATYRARRQPRPRNIRPKRRARFICAAPKVSCAAGSGVCGLRVKKTPANSQYRDGNCKGPARRLAGPFLSDCRKGIKRCVKSAQTSGSYQTFWRDTPRPGAINGPCA